MECFPKTPTSLTLTAKPCASAWNCSRNPNIVRMALTLSKDPAAGGVRKLEIVIVGLRRL